MKFNILKTRRGRLKFKLGTLIEDKGKDDKSKLEEMLVCVEEYEKNNLETIKKLRRKRLSDIIRINGALKQAIFSHGPITKELIGSASKRIYGSLLDSSEGNAFTRFFNSIR